jgi:hypothetical protein
MSTMVIERDPTNQSVTDIVISDLIDCMVVLVIFLVLTTICYWLVPWQKLSRYPDHNPKIIWPPNPSAENC